VRTEASDVDEVQVVTSSADPEQQLSGYWRLHYLKGRFSTQRIPWDATAGQVGGKETKAGEGEGSAECSCGSTQSRAFKSALEDIFGTLQDSVCL